MNKEKQLKKLTCLLLTGVLLSAPIPAAAEDENTAAQPGETQQDPSGTAQTASQETAPEETEENSSENTEITAYPAESEVIYDYRDYILAEGESSRRTYSLNINKNVSLKTSDRCIQMIKDFEGCILYAYKALPTEQYYTIGYGHYGSDVQAGMTITQEEAEALLRSDLAVFEGYVDTFLNKYTISVSQNQYDALVSFTYNLGNVWNSSTYPTFTLKEQLINGHENYTDDEITEAFTVWCKAGGNVLQALVNRRTMEAALFNENRLDSGSDSVTPAVPSCSCTEDYAGTYRCTSAVGLNVRAGHGTSYAVLTSVPYQTEIQVEKADGTWAHVTCNGCSGYVHMDYLEKVTSTSDAARLTITSQPVSCTVSAGSTAAFSVTATGSGLNYQWQYQKAGENFWTNSGASGARTSSMKIEGSADRNGQKYRCIITDSSGNSVISDTAVLTVKSSQTSLNILSQPENRTVAYGSAAVFSIQASGSGLTYQWQYQKANETIWTNSGASGARTSSMSIQATADRNGQKYRCIVTDSSGNRIISSTAVMSVTGIPDPVTVTSQPISVTVSNGQMAVFSVSASGTGLSYQWQYQKANETIWTSSQAAGAKTASMSIQATADRNGQKYRCIIKDSSGNTVTSATARMTVTTPSLAITAQPSSASVKLGTSATFSVKATGSGLKYQWQYKKEGETVWQNSTLNGAKTAAVTVPAKADRYNQSYRCIITDSSGKTVTSSTAVLSLKNDSIRILSQPSSASAKAGASVSFSVQASGTGLTYQWQYKKEGETTWTNSGMAGSASSRITVPAVSHRNNQSYRCIITAADGSVTVTDTCTLKVSK